MSVMVGCFFKLRLMIIKLNNEIDRIYPASHDKNNCIEVQMSKIWKVKPWSEIQWSMVR